MKTLSALVASAAALVGAASAMPTVVNVDLSSWAAEGQGNWNVAGDNNSVLQTTNGNPTVFHNGVDSQGVQLSGTIQVQTTGDDDFIGFVLGYNAGDLNNANADYLLIDWKQNNQSFDGGVARRGLSISRVSGAFVNSIPHRDDFWNHNGVVTELQRAANLFDTGWNDNQVYNFDLVFTASRVQVFVDNILEIDITGTFSDGAFGFYNYSQSTVRYGALTTQDAPQVPVPAAAFLFVPALAGLALKRRLKK